MSFQKILEEMTSLPGIESVIVLDSDGETIWSAGNHEAQILRLAGAHQSVLMAAMQRLAVGNHRMIISEHENRSILTRHLKDGYLITVIFSSDLNFARTDFSLGRFYQQLEAEL